MKEKLIDEEAEQIVRELSQKLFDIEPAECLICYVDRQLSQFGCDGTHRFTLHYRDRAAPRATALLRNLSQMGACCCDCEILYNAYQRVRELREAEETPRCLGVRRGSTQPCGRWFRIGRRGY